MASAQGEPTGAAGSGAGPSKVIFLSHSSADKELAANLCSALESRGVACWIAPRDIAAGQSYALGCVQGIADSQSFFLLASESALGSVQVLSEVEQAHKRRKPIYTVVVPPAKVRGEMDFYLSRLHWIDGGGRTADDIAARLAPVLKRERGWDEVASPPTLRRTMQYRPAAFSKLLGAALLGVLLVFGGAAFALNRFLYLDFRRLGYVDAGVEPTGAGGAITAHFRVWLMASGVAYSNVRLRMGIETSDGTIREQELAAWPVPEQVSSDETVEVPVGRGMRRLATCLIVPNHGTGTRYRVTQQFAMATHNGEIRVAETAEKRVSREDGSPCAFMPDKTMPGKTQ